MEITDIKIINIKGQRNLVGYASVCFDGCFVVHNIKIIQIGGEYFISMPSRKTVKGEYKDIAHPIKNDFRELLRTSILEAYKKQLDNEATF